MPSLKDYISINDGFKNAINLYLNLNKEDKVLGYIPTMSSVNILNEYIEAVRDNKSQSSILIGPYGKGKSHLLLVLLSILSMKRNIDNDKIINKLIEGISNVNNEAAQSIKHVWKNKKPFLPVIISSSQGDLNQAFLVALNDAIKRNGLDELIPETYYSKALDNIKNWKKNFKETYNKFNEELKVRNISVNEFIVGLKECKKINLLVFKEIYPKLTSGSEFNPLINSEILPLYKNVGDILCEEYNYGGIYIIFDEFSKYIESRDKTAVGNDMKLIQEMCELAQDSKSTQIFITMVTHKSIKEYGDYLTKDIINSFTGIEGRIEEKYFITSSKNNYELIQNAINKNDDEIYREDNINRLINHNKAERYYKIIPAFNSEFVLEDYEKIILRGCYPLNPISAYLLLNVSEKVAQNERTLFTFISKDEPFSMARYIKNHNENMEWSIGADRIYDYFKGIFKKDISNIYIHDEWLKAEYAIDRAKDDDQIKILKSLALINIVNKPDAMPANSKILDIAVEVKSTIDSLNELKDKDLIYFKESTQKYMFKTRVGTDLNNIIKNKRNQKGNKANISLILSQVADIDYILPKRYNQIFSMTRYFRYEFMDVNAFAEIDSSNSFFDNEQFCDGKIIALVNSELENESINEIINEKLMKFADPRIVIIKPNKVFALIKQIQDFEIIQELRHDKEFVTENMVMLPELDIFQEDIRIELNMYLDSAYNLNAGACAYNFDNESIKENTECDLNMIVSDICEKYYYMTPIINNEIINKQNISTSPTKKTRKIIMEHLLDGDIDFEFYKGTSQEATVYRSLFKWTGIDSGQASTNIKNVLEIINGFLLKCEEHKENTNILIDELCKAPIGMRLGVIPIYLAYAFGLMNDDIIIYLGNKEVELSADIIINMCEKKSDYSVFISKENIIKENYINGLQLLFETESSYAENGSRLNAVLLNIQRWYRALPQYTRNFNISNEYFKEQQIFEIILKLRPMLQKADANPYELLFEKIPELFGDSNDLMEVIRLFEKVKIMLDNHLDWELTHIANRTIQVFDKKSKEDLYHTLKNWYEKQSNISKKGLYSNKVTGLMNYIKNLNLYSDAEIVRKLVKMVSDVYVENWFDDSINEYIQLLEEIKSEVENIKDGSKKIIDMREISFTNSKGEQITRSFELASENDGSFMRNMLNDVLETFEYSVSANDKVAILTEMLEKILC